MKVVGRTYERKVRRLAHQTGNSVEALLKLGIDHLVDVFALLHTEQKHPEAVALGTARWAKVPKDERSEMMRAAVNKRWAKYREAKAGESDD